VVNSFSHPRESGDRYAVIGNPIQHSLSPQIHRLFAKQTAQSISYEAILVEPDQLAKALNDFQASGGKGLNITLPFKQQAFTLVDQLTERALRAGAINTIVFNDDGSRLGDNTDGCGLVRDIIIHHQFPIENKKIVILGAGGAVRGIIEPLLQAHPAKMVIANRTKTKAIALGKEFNVSGCGLEDLSEQTFDLVINGTSASLQNEFLALPDGLLGNNAFCYDMVYGKGVTPFLQWAQQQGANLWCDGWGMLVEQAAESFYLWRKVRPDTQTVDYKRIKID
jgi:shikimate dehydrogenase